MSIDMSSGSICPADISSTNISPADATANNMSLSKGLFDEIDRMLERFCRLSTPEARTKGVCVTVSNNKFEALFCVCVLAL